MAKSLCTNLRCSSSTIDEAVQLTGRKSYGRTDSLDAAKAAFRAEYLPCGVSFRSTLLTYAASSIKPMVEVETEHRWPPPRSVVSGKKMAAENRIRLEAID